MKMLRKTSLFCTLLVFAASLFGCKSNPNSEFETEMAQYLDKMQAVGVSMAVVKDNRIVYTKCFGFKDLETKESVTDETIFRIASISKSFTTTALLQFVDNGELSLDADVSDLLGFKVRNPKFPDKVITLEMLLSHTSSINDSQGYFNIDVINPETGETWAQCYNEYEPACGYEYCNLNLNLAGTILERISGERFDQYVVNHITKPLGLYAGYCVDSLDKTKFGKLYEFEDSSFVEQPDAYEPRSEKIAAYTMGHDAPLFSPTGGMKISAVDLAKYMIMHMNYGYSPLADVRIISEESSKNMQTPRSDDENYGLSLWLSNEYTNPDLYLVGHTGGAYGLRSAMFFNPEEKYGFTVICSGCNGYESILQGTVSRMYKHFIENAAAQE